MGEFLDGYTRGMRKVGKGVSYVDAGLVSASDPVAYAGPADGEGYDIPYADWNAFCNDIGSSDILPVPSKSGGAPVGAVIGGFGGDGAFPTWFGESGGIVSSVLIAFTDEYEAWTDEEQVDCDACKGSGEDDAGEECSDCDGTGQQMQEYDADNGGSTFRGDFQEVAFFEAKSGILMVSDPCYVLTPDNSDHPASVEAVESQASGGVTDLGGHYLCRAATGRWSASIARTDDGMVGAVLFRKA